MGQVCFHAQQAAEKSFKALVEVGGDVAPQTHDLVLLVDLLRRRHADVERHARAAAILSPYGIGPRYPVVGFDADEAQAGQALEFADAIVRWVEAALLNA